MKNIKVISMIGVCFMFLLSCKNEEESIVNTDIFNYEGLKESVVEESITPVSVTIDCGDYYRTVCISENRDSLEFVMNNYEGCLFNGDPEWPNCVKRKEPITYGTCVTFYDLNPATTYYYFVTEDGFNSDDPRKIGPMHSFKTEDLNLYVDVGGSVKWCCVNFLENRSAFDVSQFLSASLFAINELPNAENEVISGSWRYPTVEELQEICDNCSVTMVDFMKMFVKITSKNGNSLCIPFTYERGRYDDGDGYKDLMLFPGNDEWNGSCGFYGLCIGTPYITPTKNHIKCGVETKDYEIYIRKPYKVNSAVEKDFFRWSYIDGTVTPNKEKFGNEKRGVRFVVEK